MPSLARQLNVESGRIGRAHYFMLGVALLVAKHGLDWLLATLVFNRPWSAFGYFTLPVSVLRVTTWPPADRAFYSALLVVALPFIVVGVLLTARRLRDAGLPAWLVLLFFVPLVNLVFFLVLSLLPSRPTEAAPVPAYGDVQLLAPTELGRAFRPAASAETGPFSDLAVHYQDSERWRRLRSAHRRVTGDRPAASAAVALAISVPVALGFVVASAQLMGNYGAALFVGMPFCLGMGSVVLYGLTRPQSFGACMGVAFMAANLAGLGLLIIAFEGIICLIMAAPIGYALVMFGALVGYAIQARPWSVGDNPLVLLGLLVTVPGLMAAEAATQDDPPLFEVVSALEIDAPPEIVWRNVLAFPPLPEPDDWVFHTGVAYPLRAEIHGHGVGAVRHCVFSTGAFVEPIEVWDEPYLLRFRVEEQPEPMREWSPYEIHPPHLHDHLVSRQGEFKLTALPGGRTRLEGTTWYTNRMWPSAYWQLWSDAIIHRIHLRVLRHIRTLAEAEAGK